MKKIFLATIALFAIQFGFAQEEISGVTPAKTIQISETTLNFNGAGLREKWFLDLYVAALYTTSKTDDRVAVMNNDESMAITIDIVSGLITAEKFLTVVKEGFMHSTKNNTAPIQAKIELLKAAFKEEFKIGDHFVLAYIKGVGTEIHKNGKKVKTITGLEFKQALFGVWFCDVPADKYLMEGMLGLN